MLIRLSFYACLHQLVLKLDASVFESMMEYSCGVGRYARAYSKHGWLTE